MLFTAARYSALQSFVLLSASAFCLCAALGSPGLRVKLIRHNMSAPVQMNPRTEEQILYLQGERRRTEWKRESRNALWPGGPQATFHEPHSALIESCEGDVKKAFSIDLDNRTYAPVALRRKLSAEEVKSVQNRIRQPEVPPRPTVLHEITTVDQGERKKVFGYTARHVITTYKVIPLEAASVTAQGSVTDGWYIDLDTHIGCDPQNETPREGTTYSAVRLLVGSPPQTGIPSDSGSAPNVVQTTYVGRPETGFPIWVRSTIRSFVSIQGHLTEQVSTTEAEVTELSSVNLDPNLFELPEKFQPVERILPVPRVAFWARWLAWAHYHWARFTRKPADSE